MNKRISDCGAAAYEAPRMTVVPLRASGSLLIGSMENQVGDRHRFFFESNNGEPGNSVTVWNDETTSQGWSTSNSFFADGE